MQDASFLEEAARTRLTVNATSGAKVQEMVERIYSTPAELVERFSRTIGISR